MTANGASPEQRLTDLVDTIRELGAWQRQGALELERADVQIKRNASGEHSVVTQYDIESENRLHEFIRAAFPEHSFLGEESGNELRDPDHYWIVDPIDGTTNFMHNIPYWGPSVAYWRHGKPVLAVVYFPVLDEMFTAQRGAGAFMNGEPIHTSEVRAYGSLTTVALHSRTHYTHALRAAAKVRVLGSVIGNMCFTARGTFVAAHGRGRLWDIAGGVLILEEAGAIVEAQPAYDSVDLPTYATHGSAGEVFTLYVRANEHLRPLSELLERRPTP